MAGGQEGGRVVKSRVGRRSRGEGEESTADSCRSLWQRSEVAWWAWTGVEKVSMRRFMYQAAYIHTVSMYHKAFIRHSTAFQHRTVFWIRPPSVEHHRRKTPEALPSFSLVSCKVPKYSSKDSNK